MFVLKNNAPEAVIMSPEDYARLTEAEENYLLLLEATERLATNAGKDATPMSEVMVELGITDADVDAIDDVELA